jgi:tetratricopeptide (TPR) repeat protein
MAKQKRKKTKSAQSAHALRRNGLGAFHRKDYDAAIAVWERAYKQQPSPETAAALAEACFRRATLSATGDKPNLDALVTDLERAVQLKPDDARYTHHLALTLHRQGATAQAIPLYQKIIGQKGSYAGRAAYPLALALLQQGEDPAKQPVWLALTAEEQAMLHLATPAKQASQALPDFPPFWQAMAALRHGRLAEAAPTLQQSLQSEQPRQQAAITHYALGLLAAQNEAWPDAQHHWQAAYDAGLRLPALQNNLSELYHRLAEDALQGQDVAAARLAAQQAARLYEERPSAFNQLDAQIHQHQGFLAAQNGEWQTALTHWSHARGIDGGSFRLAYNFALTLEKLERFTEAGEAWREALRRRPRRSDHPDAISDEQISRLWRRAAEAYQKAGDYEEAVQVYRHAVKVNDQDLTVRMALAHSLMHNGQILAAENELNRILQIDPNHVPGLILLGEAFAANGQWYNQMQAQGPWRKALSLEPQNQQVRQLLADFYTNQAEIALSWENFDRAIQQYNQALEYMPKNPVILAGLGGCYLLKGENKTAQSFIDEAINLAPRNLHVYEPILQAWIALENTAEVEQLVARIETAVPDIPYQFFMQLASFYFQTDQAGATRPWLERAVALAPPSENLLLTIGEMHAMLGDPDIAREYLERAVKAKQEPAHAYFTLGMLAMRQGQLDLAEKQWQIAERLARKEKDFALLNHIEETRFLFSGPLGSMFGEIVEQGPSANLFNMLGQMLDQFDDPWDDDEEMDDDEWF